MAELADELYLDVDDLLPLIDALELLGFAVVEAGSIRLTPEGVTFAGADIQASKRIFADAALWTGPADRASSSTGSNVPAITRLLAGFFTQVLRRSFTEPEARQQLDVALDWGRYAELFSYDAAHDELALDPGRVPTASPES